MALNNLAPGVYSTIQDLSTFVDTQPSTTGFVAIINESGPDNELIRVTPTSYGKLFGNPDLNYTNSRDFGLGTYVAKSFLSESNNLYVMRCLPSDAEFSNIFITTDSFLNDVDTTGNQTIVCDTTSFDNINSIKEFDETLSTGIDDSGSNSTGYNLVGFRGLGRGAYYNNLLIDVNPHPNTGLLGVRQDLYIVDVYQLQKFTNRIINTDSSSASSIYSDYTLVETFEVSFDPNAKDEVTDSIFIEDIINNYSNLIRVKTNKVILKEMAKRIAKTTDTLTIDFSDGFINSHSTITENENNISYGIQMQYGDDKIFTQYGLVSSDNTSGHYPGDILAKAYSGTLESVYDSTSPIETVLDTENFQFDVVFDAGYPADVKTQIVMLTTTRKDCLAIIDNGDHFTATQALDTRQNSGDDSTFAYNTPYASLYEPYSKVFDPYTGSDIFMPPSFHVARIVGFNDKTTEIWYPLAGFNRAIINNIKELRYNPSLGDRESFIKYQINPIVKFGIGYALFSQRTTYRKSSALQEIHIIRLQMFIDRSLKEFCRNFIFELNDEETRAQIRKEINVFLSEIKSRRGLQSYTVTTPSSDYDIKRRRISVNITLKPTRSVEQIYLNYFLV